PFNTLWDDQAALVASLWAAKDGRAAIVFVSSHRVDRRAALEAGRTWALHDPAAAASWLRDQAGLTRGECAGSVCGLAVSEPGLAREFVSRPGEIYQPELSEISSAVRQRGIGYFAEWVNGVENAANRKSIVTYQIRSGKKFQESLEIIRLFSDPALREQCYAYISRDLNPAQAADFFESIPGDERAAAVTSLLFRTSEEEEGGELAAELMRKLPADQRERAVLRLLKEEIEPDSSDTLESMKQERIETLERLVPDPEEREKIRAKWPEPLTVPPGSKEPQLPEPPR
ncbi:MAG: hypothetical protein JWO82_2414, partial [Akkermansiaceae bacterium]|nr:hypothetical protein [Akkermansiaceae bacterium]